MDYEGWSVADCGSVEVSDSEVYDAELVWDEEGETDVSVGCELALAVMDEAAEVGADD